MPHGTRWPIFGLDRPVHDDARRGVVAERHSRRPVDRDGRLRRPARDAVRLVRHRHRRERGRPLQPQGRRVVPLGDELVHLLRGHVLRRVLRHAVLCARARRAVARRRGRQLLHELPALAGLREHVAVDGPAGERRRAHGRVGLAGRSTRRSCCSRASRSRSRITRCARVIARRSSSGSRRRSCSASCSSASRPRSTSTPTPS